MANTFLLSFVNYLQLVNLQILKKTCEFLLTFVIYLQVFFRKQVVPLHHKF